MWTVILINPSTFWSRTKSGAKLVTAAIADVLASDSAGPISSRGDDDTFLPSFFSRNVDICGPDDVI